MKQVEPATRDGDEERVLVLAPTGRDAELTCDVLTAHSIAAKACATMTELCAELGKGAGTLLIAEEALSSHHVEELTVALRNQPPWSDIPLIITLIADEPTEARVRTIQLLEPSGNVSILERPTRVFTMLVTVQTALRARRRQYELRHLLVNLEDQMRQLQNERELRSRFVSLLAHDLRGPISAAMISAELLERMQANVPAVAGRIQRNLRRADRMVVDLLDATRIGAGQTLTLELHPCDVAAIVREVVDELRVVHGERFVLDVVPTLPGAFAAEELRRAVWNLVSNAVKYGAADHPVTVTVRSVEGMARITVHNRGNPIPADKQQTLFEPFARAAEDYGERASGWGLGLTLVRGCAEAHGGCVRLTSTAESGTTFTLELPLRTAVAVESAIVRS